MKKKNILAIGCGGAGMFSLVVASQLKKGHFTTKVLSEEENIYCRCTSTYVLSGDATLDDAIQPDSMVGDYVFLVTTEKSFGERLDQIFQQNEVMTPNALAELKDLTEKNYKTKLVLMKNKKEAEKWKKKFKKYFFVSKDYTW
jgi:hypothetical protein